MQTDSRRVAGAGKKYFQITGPNPNFIVHAISFKFKENGQVEGTVEFTKDARGQSIFITKAEKGTYRTTRNGYTSSRPIPKDELNGQHSCTYLWEKANLKDDPKNIYLLMVDLEAHPNIDLKDPRTIDPSWASKFHIPAQP